LTEWHFIRSWKGTPSGKLAAWSGSSFFLSSVPGVCNALQGDLRVFHQFLGIHQIRKDQARSAMTGSGDFDETGVLGIIRHPWYVAVFILLWTGDLNRAAIMVNLVLSACLIVGTLLEERKLVTEFGEEYRRYQERVSMFIPLKWLTARRAP